MKKESGVSSVLGTVFLVGLIAIAAAAGCTFAIVTLTSMADEAPLAMFETSEVANMMYHSGGDTIDMANTKVYHHNNDITDKCKIATLAGGTEYSFTEHPMWKTGEVLVLYDPAYSQIDQNYVSIVTSDGGNAYVVLKKGEDYVGPQEECWIITVLCRDKDTNELLEVRDIKIPKRESGEVNLEDIAIPGYQQDPDNLKTKVFDINELEDKNTAVTLLFIPAAEVKFTVIFDPNGGVFQPSAPGLDKTSGNVVVEVNGNDIAGNPSGYLSDDISRRFLYWYATDPKTEFNLSTTPITGNVHLFARWSYAVTFDLGEYGEWDGDNECVGPNNNIVYTDGDGKLPYYPMNVVRNDGETTWVLIGWQDENGNPIDFSKQTFLEPTTLYPIWSQVQAVKFNPNGGTWEGDYDGNGTDTISLVIKDGKIENVPGADDLTYGDNEFDGWYDQNGHCWFDKDGNPTDPDYVITPDIQLTARWHYAITFLPNGGKWSDGTNAPIVIYTKTEPATGKEYLDLSDLPRNLKKDNNVFKGWPYNGNVYETNKFAVSAYKGSAIDTRLYFTKAETLNAKWALGTTWAIIFHPCGGKWPGNSYYAQAYDLYKSTGNRQYLLDQIIVVKVVSDNQWGPGANDAIYELITNHLGLGDKIPVLSDTSTIPELSSYYMPYKVNSDGSRGKPMDDTWYEFFVYRHDPAGTQYNTIGVYNEDHVWADMAYKSPEYLQSAAHKAWWAENKDKGWTENFWGDFSRVSYNSLSHYSWDDKYANNDPVHTVIYAAADHATIYPEKDVVNELRDKGLIITTEAKY